MNAADNPQISELFNASARDEKTLSFPVPSEIFGLHTQQAIEKLLKVLITAHGERHPFTHELPALLRQLESLGEHFKSWALTPAELTVYSVDSRYTSGVELSDTTRDALRADVVTLREYVTMRAAELKALGTQVKNP